MKAATEILIVEDDERDLELTIHALRGENIANNIQVARDGEEALDFLFNRGSFAARGTQEVPRLVLLDLKLPKVNGMEVLQQIKGDPRLKKVPVVVLTSSREDRDLVSSYELGVNSYIQKPVEFDQFRETIKQLGLYWLVVNEVPIGTKPGGKV
jgi:two-component system, response regulator